MHGVVLLLSSMRWRSSFIAELLLRFNDLSLSTSPNIDTADGAICKCERFSELTVSRRFKMRVS